MSNLDKTTFPYKPPSKEIFDKYAHLFKIIVPIRERGFKRLLDIIISLILILISSPVLIFIIISYNIEFFINPKSRGKIFYYYKAISQSKEFNKYKIRVIYSNFIDKNLASNNVWGAHKLEWNKNCLTFTGKFVKKFYLDEIPQFFNILNGDISLIGPRALSVFHYNKDIEQGNIIRKFIRGGLIGNGHVHKGSDDMGNPEYEYEYLDSYINSTFLDFYLLEFKIIIKSIVLVLKGGGH